MVLAGTHPVGRRQIRQETVHCDFTVRCGTVDSPVWDEHDDMADGSLPVSGRYIHGDYCVGTASLLANGKLIECAVRFGR